MTRVITSGQLSIVTLNDVIRSINHDSVVMPAAAAAADNDDDDDDASGDGIVGFVMTTDIYHVRKTTNFTDHPRSGVLYNFGCLSVCLYLYVCQTITLESLDVGSSYLHTRYISMEYGSSSYMKVIGSRSR